MRRFINDLERPAGTHLLGRRMYELMTAWETDPALAAESPIARDFAEIWQAADKLVYSKTLAAASTRKTRIERDFDPAAVRELKQTAQQDILIGGPGLAARAFRAGLVDECCLFLAPVSVGGGKPALPAGARLDLALLGGTPLWRRGGVPEVSSQVGERFCYLAVFVYELITRLSHSNIIYFDSKSCYILVISVSQAVKKCEVTMGIHSPFAGFVEVLGNVKERALLYQGRLSKSEASTRVALIDPILNALGWDTSNPNMIEFEKTLPQSRADYALYNQENKIQVIIEAKALGVNLGDKTFVFNLIMYAIAAGIKDIYLTDGVIWEHYSDFSPGNVISSKTIDLTKDNLLDCAVYLVNELDAAKFWQGLPVSEDGINDLLSKQILDLRSEISNLKQVLSALQTPTSSMIPSPAETSSPPAEQKPEEQFQFVELINLPEKLTGQKPPVLIRLPDGSTKKISKWRDILLESVGYVLANNPSITIPLPDAAGKKVKLLDTKPLPEGIAQHKTSYNGKDIYIYANYDARHCVTNALYILGKMGQAKNSGSVAVVFGNDKDG